MRNGKLLKSHVSEIRVKQIRVNQGVGVFQIACYWSLLSVRFNYEPGYKPSYLFASFPFQILQVIAMPESLKSRKTQ